APLAVCLPIALTATTPAAAEPPPGKPPAALPPAPPAALPPLPAAVKATAIKAPAPSLFADDGPPIKAGDIRRLSSSFAGVAEKVSPSVVQIDVTAGGIVKPPLRWIHGGDSDRHG